MRRGKRRSTTRVETDAALLWEAMKVSGLSAKETAEQALRDAIVRVELRERIYGRFEKAEKKA